MWVDQEQERSERELLAAVQPQHDPADEAFEAWLASLGEGEGGDEPPPPAAGARGAVRRAPRGLAAAFAAALLCITGCGGAVTQAALAPVRAMGTADPYAQADRDHKPKHPRVAKLKAAADECPGLSRLQCAATLEYNACIRSAAGCTDEQLDRDNSILTPPGS